MPNSRMKYYEQICDRSVTTDETAEISAGLSKTESDYIVCAEGIPLIRSKNIDRGRVSVSGTLICEVLCCNSEENRCTRLEYELPYSVTVEDDGIDESCRADVQIMVLSLDARMTSSNTVTLNARIEAHIKVYSPTEVELETSGLEVCGDAEKHIECVTVRTATEIAEKNFIVSDELTVGNENQSCEILLRHVALKTTELKPVGNKLLVNGSTDFELLCCDGETGMIGVERTELPFSQVIDIKGGAGREYSVSLFLSGFYAERLVSAGQTRLSTELHIVAQVTATDVTELIYISDAYSKECELRTDMRQCTLKSIGGSSEYTKNCELMIDTPYAPTRIISAKTGVASVSYASDKIFCSVPVYLLYMSENSLPRQSTGILKAEFDTDAVSNSWFIANVKPIGVPRTYVTAGGVEVSLELCCTVERTDDMTISYLSSAEPGDERDRSKLPTYVLCRQDKGESLWELAKRCCSSEQLIAEVNGEGFSAECTSSRFLLIPKA